MSLFSVQFHVVALFIVVVYLFSLLKDQNLNQLLSSWLLCILSHLQVVVKPCSLATAATQ